MGTRFKNYNIVIRTFLKRLHLIVDERATERRLRREERSDNYIIFFFHILHYHCFLARLIPLEYAIRRENAPFMLASLYLIY